MPDPLPPTLDEAGLMHDGQVLMGFIWPAQNRELLDRLAAHRISALAMDCVPRISRAQKCDALSSMSNVAGYRAVIEAADRFGRFFTGEITAAGRIPPCKVLVIGAGVAGLAAIGAARGLGAIVRAFDARSEVREQVQSLGAEFIEVSLQEEGAGTGGYAKAMSPEYLEAELALFRKQAEDVDIIITTALIPGKPSPRLITEDTVKALRPGSVIVDLAAELGGNCELTVPGEVVVRHGVTIIGYTDLPSRLAPQSSTLYSTNLSNLLTELAPARDGIAVLNMDDEVIRGVTVIKDGTITWPPPRPVTAVPAPSKPAEPPKQPEKKKPARTGAVLIAMLATAAALTGIGYTAPPAFLVHVTVFVLAIFVGYLVIWNVTPALHTPLMSITNAISSIIIIGALVQLSAPVVPVWILAGVAVGIAFINIAGGFSVTWRMLKMFRK